MRVESAVEINAINKPLELVREKDCDEAMFPEKVYSIAIYPNQIIVLGQPPSEPEGDENTWHNCEQMGCGWEHVLMRITVDKITNVLCDVPNRLKDGFSKY